MAKTQSSCTHLRIGLLLWGVMACHPPQWSAQPKAERIISTVLLGDDFLVDLLAPDQLERVVGFSTIFEDYAQNETLEKVQGATKARFSLHNIEAIVAANPDVVLVGSFSDAPAYQQLAQFGITVQVLQVATTLDEVKEQLMMMGELLQRGQQAEHLLEQMLELSHKITQNRTLLQEGLSILDFNAYGVSAGPNTSLGLVFHLAGLHNSAVGLPYFDVIGYAPLGVEAVFKLNPDFLLCDEATAQLLMDDRRFDSLKAVQRGQVLVPDHASRQRLFSPNRHLLEATVWLQQQVLKRQEGLMP